MQIPQKSYAKIWPLGLSAGGKVRTNSTIAFLGHLTINHMQLYWGLVFCYISSSTKSLNCPIYFWLETPGWSDYKIKKFNKNTTYYLYFILEKWLVKALHAYWIYLQHHLFQLYYWCLMGIRLVISEQIPY